MPYPRGIVTVLSFLIVIATLEFAKGFMKLGSTHLLHASHATTFKLHVNKRDVSKIEKKWIKQPLDHFDASEKRTLKMRYFERLDHWQPNGPIYVFISLEGLFGKKWIAFDKKSLICQMAKDTNGSLLATEHRYYGKSKPDISYHNITEYYKFLSSRQALADLANLIRSVKSDPKYKSSKVVAVGGWYTGNLATWLRGLYPDLVDAALAASAPVLAQKDFKEYYEGLTYVYGKYGSKNCLNNIEKYFKRCEKLLQTSDGIKTLKKELNICPSSNLTVKENQQWLFYTLLYGSLDVSGNTSDVKDTCKNFERGDIFTEDLFNNAPSIPFSSDCYPIDFKSVDFTHNPINYQMCLEFSDFMTTSSQKQPFGHWNPLEFELKLCQVFFKEDTEKRIDEGVARTNKMYGGKHPNVTKVVFTHGDMDPWHALGVLQDLGPEAPAIMVNETSMAAILLVQQYELEELKKKRKYVKELIKKWISTA